MGFFFRFRVGEIKREKALKIAFFFFSISLEKISLEKTIKLIR